jgi:DNA-binding CsgD family transcriptional regulator/tetratricopeptide (TPR) repeat protein
LVHHAREANDVASIIKLAPQAARAATTLDSHRQAVAHFRTLDPYFDQIPDADRGAIVDDWARAEFYFGTGEAPEVLALAIALHRSTGDDRALARTLTFAIRVNEAIGRPHAADACAAEAVAILESHPPGRDLADVLSQQAWISMMRGDRLGAIALADQAISLAEVVGDELIVIHSLNTKGTTTYVGGNPDGRRLLDEARIRAQRAGDAHEETRALFNLASAVAARCEMELASDLAQQAIGTAVRYEIRSLEKVARALYAEILEWRGEWVVAEDLSAELLESSPGRNFLHVLMAGRVLGRLQARRGVPEARDTLNHTWSSTEVNAEMQHLLPAAAALAEYMWLTGDDDPHRLTRFRDVLEKGLRPDNHWIGGDLAFWLWKLGELSEAPEGIAEPYRMVIEGRPVEAAAVWESMGLPYERALALMHGENDARLEALEQFETMGATAVAAKLRQMLRADGVSVPRGRSQTTRDHAAGLTARQAEILELLGEGLTNIEIADRLFVSPRTVEHHVAAVMSKLEASSRDDAVAKAANQGLLSV